jgi:hypothetical protein
VPLARRNQQQLFKAGTLLRIWCLSQLLPKAGGDPVAHRSNQASKGACSWQEYLPLYQSGSSQIEEHAWTLGAQPGPAIEPPYQLEVLRLVVKIAITVSSSYLADMFSMGSGAVKVVRQVRDRLGVVALAANMPDIRIDGVASITTVGTADSTNTELGGDKRYNSWRYVSRIGKEGAQEANRAELYGEPKPVVFAPALADERTVVVTQMEIASKLSRGRLAVVAAISLQHVI